VAGSGSSGRGSGDPNRRPTKAERREDARLKREHIQRQMKRRRRNRSIGFVLVVVAIVTVVVAVFATAGGGGSSITSASDLLKQASQAEKAAGCGPVKTIDFYGGVSDTTSPNYHDQTHIGTTSTFPTPPKLSTYPSTPPTSGPHDPTPLPAGIYDSPPSIYQAIHSLEHGGTIIWYPPGTSSKQLDDLKAFYGQQASKTPVGQDRVIIAPYDYPDQGTAGQLPAGVQMALVAWHRLQTCSNVSLAAAFDFTSQYEYPVYDGRQWKGVAPERGAQM
jgi:hypothetical protein